MARTLLIAGSVLLVATALFHMTGLSSVAELLGGDRGRIIELLWGAAALNWGVVALLWSYAAVRPAAALQWPVWISAIIPISLAFLLLGTIDPAHPGGYMLLVASALACIGAWRMR